MVFHDFVEEYGKVQGEAELERVARMEGDQSGTVVVLKSVGFGQFEVSSLGVLGNVTIVVTDLLEKEGLWLAVTGLLEYVVIDHVNDALAVLAELLLDAGLVLGQGIGEFGVLWVLLVLLNETDFSAGETLGADEVLEGIGHKVALIASDIGTLLLHDFLEQVNHILEAFSFFGHTG